MKYLFAFILLFLGIPYGTDNECLSCQKQDNDYTCAANTLSMNFRLCMDMTEVSGLMYKTFLEDLRADYGPDSREYVSNLPDFSKWEELFPGKTLDTLSQMFFEDEVFALMPIVAVSYEQAVNFCNWRTERFKEELSEMSPEDRARFPKDFKFRLPTPKEWARMRFMVQQKGMLKQVEKTAKNNLKVFKFKKNELLGEHPKLEHIYANQDPKLGMFNLFDNVAEMTSEEGVALGGSWKLANKSQDFEKSFNYTAPEAWLGFRCIFEIIE